MDRLEYALTVASRMMANKRKRHIIGGALISVSMLFGSLALTVMSIKNEEIDDEQQY